MDIRKFAVGQTGRLHLSDADNELMFTEDGKEVAINLFSPASHEYSKANTTRANRTLDKYKKKGKSDLTSEQVEKENAEFLADCTASFENIDYNGLQGRELFVAVYSDMEIGFIADQVAAFLGDWANFTKASPTN